MIGGEIWLEEFLQSFLESLTNEELENLIKEIQEELRRRRVERGISIGLLFFPLKAYTTSYGYAPP